MRRSAFTLIEMLVVIAIILILARLLMPVVSSAREHAYTAQCASNLHQMDIAFKMYTQDYNNYYPRSATDVPSSHSENWVHSHTSDVGYCSPGYTALGKYANPSNKPCTKTIYWCKADGNPSVDSGASPAWATSYRMNDALSLRPANLVQYSAGTYLLLEGAESTYGNGAFELSGTQHTTDRHHGGSNALYCDGHVKWSNKGNTSTPGTFDYDTGANLKGFYPNGTCPASPTIPSSQCQATTY